MFDRIEEELKGLQHALYLRHTMPTAPFPAGDIEVGDEPA
jgi:hypothetical protein